MSKIYTQTNHKPFVYLGGEIDYYLCRYSFFGFSIGGAYSFDKTYYNFRSYLNYDSRQIRSLPTNVNGSGSGSFSNHMFKFVWGLNFNFNFGLNILIQPLNPEFRSIQENNDFFIYKTYKNYPYYTGNMVGYDSVSVLVGEEKRKEDFKNYKTGFNYCGISFPSTFGIEQKFKIGKLKYVAGVSASISLLEQYIIYRAHIGFCFGNFKDKSQPGY